ncbi:MAG: ribonuclease N [Actinobacteria bacterium]|nr:ribonuclease N [Actinomycetota bacterium]
MRNLRRARRPLIALVVLVAALLVGYAVKGTGSGDSHESGGSVALSALPPQAATTVKLIEQGGPFPYPRNDGVVFHNNQHLLPEEPDGYYHEYTVPTPGAGSRGTRRIITGTDGRYWYTGDHYETFQLIELNR